MTETPTPSEMDPIGQQELDESLADSFQKVLDINDELENSALASNDPRYQTRVADAIARCERMTNQINELALFRTNETAKEISTEHLKYLLLPALLGHFTLKNVKSDRAEVLETAQIYFKDFISRLNDYELSDVPLGDENSATGDSGGSFSLSVDSLVEAAKTRNAKIARLRQMKQLETDISQMKELIKMQRSGGHPVDEDVEREFYLKLIKRWLNHALDELVSIKAEIPLVKQHAAMKAAAADSAGNSSASKRNPKLPPPLKPIVIMKDQRQKAVFGAGYPSLPTYTVDEFVDQKMRDKNSMFSADNKVYTNSLYDWATNPDQKNREEEQEEERKERLTEQDDAAELARLRKWDDWKDQHRRGEGNRHNMG